MLLRLPWIFAAPNQAQFNCILQYQNMRTTEDFAKSSEEATDVMQVWTEQMHEKTMSMHVITVFTLIFLPGTFVAVCVSLEEGRWSPGNKANGLPDDL